MYKVLVVARNTSHECVRQPLFWILVLSFSGMIWASQFFTMFTLDAALESYLLREMGISSIALGGALLAVLLSWLCITRDMERLTALTVLSKPVLRTHFLLGKFFGILAAVFYAAGLLAAVLVMTLWQKDAGPRYDQLATPEEVFFPDFTSDLSATIVSLAPVEQVPTPSRWLVRLDKGAPERAEERRRSGAPDGGRFMNGTLTAWRDDAPVTWTVESSRAAADGTTELVIFAADPRHDPALGKPGFVQDPETKRILPKWPSPRPGPRETPLPQVGEDIRVLTSYVGAAQLHVRDFWTKDVPKIFKGAFLATTRVAILLAFAAALAPHATLVVNGALCFFFFLLGHVSNYIHLALEEKGFFLRWVGRIFYTLLPNLENSRVESLVAAGQEISNSYVFWSAAYGVAYVALVLLAGTSAFSRKEIR